MSERPYARIYAFRHANEKNILAGCEIRNPSGLVYHDQAQKNLNYRLALLKTRGYELSLVQKPSEILPDMFPADCELVLPFPKEIMSACNLEELLGQENAKDDEGTRKYPV
jgi:hypothetical protein